MNNFLTHTNRATIGEPESASVTDIFGAVYIDPVAEKGGPFAPKDWKRYRDDIWDLEENVTDTQLHEFTEYVNSSFLQNKITFNLFFTKPFGTHTFYQGGGGLVRQTPYYLKNRCSHELEIL